MGNYFNSNCGNSKLLKLELLKMPKLAPKWTTSKAVNIDSFISFPS